MNKLKKLRVSQGLTVRKLAEKADVDLSTISLLENDRQKGQLSTLGKLARALGVDVDELSELADNTASERGKKGVAARLGKFQAALKA